MIKDRSDIMFIIARYSNELEGFGSVVIAMLIKKELESLNIL